MSDGSGAVDAPSGRSLVLVATSDSATRNLLRQILQVGRVDIVDAVDGVEALALARKLDLDLIVLDAFLAVLDAIAVCGRIRALPDLDQPPILMVGLISERAVELAVSVGADETLAKPLSPSLIRTRTRALLARRREERRRRLAQRAVDAAPVGITLLDARSTEYSVTHANPAFLQLTRYSADEILGHNLRMLTGPETDVTSMTALRDNMAAGRSSRVLLRNYRKDGQPFWNDLSVAPVLDHAGRLTHFVAVQSDVTDHVEASKSEATRALEAKVLERTHEVEASLVALEERRRFAETILNSLASALVTTDSSRTVTFANLSALRTLGVSVAECVGRSVLEIFGHNEAVAEVVEGAVPPHPEHRLDFPLTTPGGSRVYIGLSIVRAPPELRDEIDLIFLFRNLAETVLEEDDPRLTALGASTGVEAAEADLDGEAAAPADPQSARRRLTLSLHYTQLTGLMQAVIDDLAAERGQDGAFVGLEAEADVPEVLLDRRQVSEALRLLLRSLLERCDDPSEIRVRVRREAGEAGGGRTRPAACIELLWRRELITEGDLEAQAEATGRPPHRRADLAEAEKLIEANGGRLRRPLREAEEQSLTVLFPSAT